MSLIEMVKERLNLGRFGRFALVGGLGTGLDVGLLMVLTAVVNLPTLPANVLSYSTGIVNNYYWNRRWTFSASQRRDWRSQFAQFALVSLIGLGLNSLLVVWLESTVGLLPAKAAATGVVLLWNYNANRIWTFSGMAQVEVM